MTYGDDVENTHRVMKSSWGTMVVVVARDEVKRRRMAGDV